MLRFPQRVRYISLYRCFSFFASTNLGNCVFQPSAAPVLRPAPNVCIISRNFINTSDFLIYFQKELAFFGWVCYIIFCREQFSFEDIFIAAFLLLFRQTGAGRNPPSDPLRSAFCFIRSANKTLKIRFPGTVSRICHLDAAGWHPIQFNGTHYIVKGERRQCGSRQPRSLRKSCP